MEVYIVKLPLSCVLIFFCLKFFFIYFKMMHQEETLKRIGILDSCCSKRDANFKLIQEIFFLNWDWDSNARYFLTKTRDFAWYNDIASCDAYLKLKIRCLDSEEYRNISLHSNSIESKLFSMLEFEWIQISCRKNILCQSHDYKNKYLFDRYVSYFFSLTR